MAVWIEDGYKWLANQFCHRDSKQVFSRRIERDKITIILQNYLNNIHLIKNWLLFHRHGNLRWITKKDNIP